MSSGGGHRRLGVGGRGWDAEIGRMIGGVGRDRRESKSDRSRDEDKEMSSGAPRITKSDTTCEAPWPSMITGDVRSSTRHRIRHGEGDDPDPQFSVSEFKTEMIAILHDSIDSVNNASLRRTRRSHSTRYARIPQYIMQ